MAVNNLQPEAQRILLIDLPTYPKGTVALSLYAVAAAMEGCDCQVIDLNVEDWEEATKRMGEWVPDLVGLKVSAQNHGHAISVTVMAREHFPATLVMWGGELPTLLPDECLKHCDVAVQGAIEPIVRRLLEDLGAGSLAKRYDGREMPSLSALHSPRLDLLAHPDRYPRFMGLPMESSRGCTFKCTFCMVHSMQPRYLLKTEEQLKAELHQYRGRFLNLVDYNFGVDPEHVKRVASAIRDSEVLGWMGEMCLESLDNDEVLRALAESRCRMIYCGLEAIDELGLKSINKARTNQIAHYDQIIAKVQSYGIQIAAGMIIGLEGATQEGMERMRQYFQERGILYIKLTFLTYNPGTKVKQSMLRTGSYTTEAIEQYDGMHLTFLPEGVDPQEMYAGAEAFIKQFYSLSAIRRRSRVPQLDWRGRMEFILFNLCYREVYLEWLRQGIFRDEAAFQAMLAGLHQPSGMLKWADQLLDKVRRRRYLMEKP
ncbi:MAG: radical SAM protein [Bacteroidia bacterium]